MIHPAVYSPSLFSLTARRDGDEIYVVLICSECAANGPIGGRVSVWPVGPAHVAVNAGELERVQRTHWDALHAGTPGRNGGGTVVQRG